MKFIINIVFVFGVICCFPQWMFAQNTPKYHTVQHGEGLYRVAVNNKVTMEEIRRWNNLTSDVLAPGQRLVVGFQGGVKETVKENTTGSGDSRKPKYYIVKQGEGLYRVAVNNSVTMEQIRQWNKLSSDNLAPGQKIMVGYESSSQPVPSQAINEAEDYSEIILKADKAFNTGNYDAAKKYYQDALKVKPETNYPKMKLAEIDKVIVSDNTEQVQQPPKAIEESVDKQYNEALMAGYSALRQSEYEQAKKYFEQAAKLKPDEMLPKDKLKEVTEQLAQSALTDETEVELKRETKPEVIAESEPEKEEETYSSQPQVNFENTEVFYTNEDIPSINMYPEKIPYYPSRYTLNFYYPGIEDYPGLLYMPNSENYPGNYYSEEYYYP